MRIKHKVNGDLNATFVSLILKVDKPSYFSDFRPISLCNTIYTLIAKVISNCVKASLPKFMSMEQFGFMSNHQIMDAIGVS